MKKVYVRGKDIHTVIAYSDKMAEVFKATVSTEYGEFEAFFNSEQRLIHYVDQVNEVRRSKVLSIVVVSDHY